MRICIHNHQPIVYSDVECPVCKLKIDLDVERNANAQLMADIVEKQRLLDAYAS